MQQRFRSAKILFAVLIVYCLLPSCKTSQDKKDFVKSGKVLVGPIEITGYETSDSSLVLQDSGRDANYVRCKRKQKIKWEVINQPNLRIIAIGVDTNFDNNPNFFSLLPHQQGNHWEATIGEPDSTKGFLEKYYIEWELRDSAHSYTYDPLMQLNPSK